MLRFSSFGATDGDKNPKVRGGRRSATTLFSDLDPLDESFHQQFPLPGLESGEVLDEVP
jgi:hypothetical protein